MVEALARFRQVLEDGQRKARHGRIVALGRQVHPQPVVEQQAQGGERGEGEGDDEAAAHRPGPPGEGELLHQPGGADAGQAWADPRGESDPHVHAVLRMARRSAASGAALAQGVEDLAVTLRADAADAAGARAERAAVLIAGPLGLCYLPAFLCLGIVPVVAGLAGDVLRSGVL